MLRAYAGEPILDVVRRIVDTTGIDIELASAVSPAAAARRDNLDLFLKAVAEFQAIDGDVTLPALLAYLDRRGRPGQRSRRRDADRGRLGQAADRPPRQGAGVGLGLPGRRRARRGSRPTGRARCGPRRRRCSRRRCAATRPTSRSSPAGTRPRSTPTAPRTRDHDAVEELRLGYVAFTRAAHDGSRSRPTCGARARRRSARRRTSVVPDRSTSSGRAARPGSTSRRRATPTPTPPSTRRRRGRSTGIGREAAAAARGGQPGARRPTPTARTPSSTWSRPPGSATGTPSSTGCSPRPGATGPTSSTCRCRRACRPPRWPAARRPGRVRPRAGPADAAPAVAGGPVRHPVPRLGRGALRPAGLLDPDDLPGRGDLGIDDEDDLAELIARFEAGPFADRVPHAVEPPFALVLAGQVVRGRIDAVYAEPDGYLVVDWKTNRAATADPLQLAIYRLAWAELHRRAARAGARRVPLRAHRRDRRARGPAGPSRRWRRCCRMRRWRPSRCRPVSGPL